MDNNPVLIRKETYKYFSYRKGSNKDPKWHIRTAILYVGIYKDSYIDPDHKRKEYTHFIVYNEKEAGYSTSISADLEFLNEVRQGSYMIADMDKGIEYFKEKMREYFDNKAAEAQKKLDEFSYKKSLLDNVEVVNCDGAVAPIEAVRESNS